MDVVVDTCIPCLDGRAPCFVKMKDPDEFWMIFLEKACACLDHPEKFSASFAKICYKLFCLETLSLDIRPLLGFYVCVCVPICPPACNSVHMCVVIFF